MEDVVDDLHRKLKITESEEQPIQVSNDVWHTTTAIDHDLCLVGRVVTRKSINLEAFQRTMAIGWNLANTVKIQKLGQERILFRFDHIIDKGRVLAGGPWSFDKHLVVLRGIQAGEVPMTVDLDFCEFYVRVREVPFRLRHWKMAEFLGRVIGRCVDVDLGRCLGMDLRIRVCIDVTKPLRRLIKLSGPNGEEFTVYLSYERLPNFCYYCGIIGHLVRDCPEVAAENGEELDSVLQYGDWLRSDPNNLRDRFVRGSI